jgi:hypothetical protein
MVVEAVVEEAGSDRVFNLELRTFRNRDVVGQEFSPNAGAVDATHATVIEYPEKHMEISGCHRPSGFGSRRQLATTEEKNKIADDRARRELRRTCLYYSIDHLWTLNYRGPEFDRDKANKDVQRWERLVRKTYRQFKAVGVFEKHQGGGINNGGYHYHCGVNGFYEVQVLRSAWWKVVGEAKGNVQVVSKCGESPIRVSAYLAKYMSKDIEVTGRRTGQHRYRRSQRLEVPRLKLTLGVGRALERETQLKEYIKRITGRDIAYEWHSDDGLRFMFRTFR